MITSVKGGKAGWFIQVSTQFHVFLHTHRHTNQTKKEGALVNMQVVFNMMMMIFHIVSIVSSESFWLLASDR